MYDVVVIGAGVIGLSVANFLANEGATVAVLDANCSGAASQVSAGMLAPLGESDTPGPLVDWGIRSLSLYPDFLSRLREETNDDIALSTDGLIRVAMDPDELAELKKAFVWQSNYGMSLDWLSVSALKQIEPDLSPNVIGAILSPMEKRIDAVRLCRVLADSSCRKGVSIYRGSCFTGFDRTNSHIASVSTSTERIPCGASIITGGAWSTEIAMTLGLQVPIEPIRGQIVSMRCCSQVPFKHIIYSNRGYLVPDADGQVLSGASVERAGFNISSSVCAVERLLRNAMEFIPSLSHAAFDGVKIGLRPSTPDGLPFMGSIPGLDNGYIASGHSRNGVLLAPITASIMADCVLRQKPPPLAFSVSRFSAVL